MVIDLEPLKLQCLRSGYPLFPPCTLYRRLAQDDGYAVAKFLQATSHAMGSLDSPSGLGRSEAGSTKVSLTWKNALVKERRPG
jgi:hypothetical protein